MRWAFAASTFFFPANSSCSCLSARRIPTVSCSLRSRSSRRVRLDMKSDLRSAFLPKKSSLIKDLLGGRKKRLRWNVMLGTDLTGQSPQDHQRSLAHRSHSFYSSHPSHPRPRPTKWVECLSKLV